MEFNEEVFFFQTLEEEIGHPESNTVVPGHFSAANSVHLLIKLKVNAGKGQQQKQETGRALELLFSLWPLFPSCSTWQLIFLELGSDAV